MPGEDTDALEFFPHTFPYTSLPNGCSTIYFVIDFHTKLVNNK